eukprot:10422447-Alexandrium_andersonii.AAC.2
MLAASGASVQEPVDAVAGPSTRHSSCMPSRSHCDVQCRMWCTPTRCAAGPMHCPPAAAARSAPADGSAEEDAPACRSCPQGAIGRS